MTGKTKTLTRGGVRLAAADSYAAIAERLGVSKTLVAYWATGDRAPKKSDIERIAEAYGIPAEAWKEPPSSKCGRSKQRPPKAERPAALAPSPTLPSSEDDDDDDDDETTTARLHRFIRDGLRELESDTELSTTKKADSLKKLVDARCALDKSTGANAVTMAKILAHPGFKHAVQTITDAIAPYPEALAAATKALEAVIAKS